MKVLMSYFLLESNEHVTGLTELDSFNLKFGDSLIESMHVKDIFEQNNIDIIPGIYANGHAATVMSQESFAYVRSKLIRMVKENLDDIDGIYLFLHGASKIEGLPEGSGDRQLLKDIREITGPYMPIVVIMDPHGNLTEDYVSDMTYGRSYRHSPHTDIVETFEIGAHALVDLLNNKRDIIPSYRKLPFVLGGEMSVSTDEPMVSINKKLDEIEKDERIMSASFHVGYLRHDNYATGSGLIVVPTSNKYREYAEEIIDELYEYCVAQYPKFHYHGTALEENKAVQDSIDLAHEHIVVTDSGDNVTSGASGINTHLLQLYLEKDLNNKRIIFAGITDKKSYHELKKSENDVYQNITLGDETQKYSPIINLTVKIVNRGDLQQIFGVTDNYGETLTLKIKDKNIEIVLIEQSISFAEYHQFEAANIKLEDYNIIVVKQGYIFPELKEFADYSIMALTDGPTNQDPKKLVYKQIKRPMLPFDKL